MTDSARLYPIRVWVTPARRVIAGGTVGLRLEHSQVEGRGDCLRRPGGPLDSKRKRSNSRRR